ncbi:hypothetical protein [Variovorax sp. KK3]|uniref:hypothetical protein n=1 Tax=Variovorax sp. KK3 TaxID=1855728 RepID=UPI00117ECDD2|nr:hypothetical protein [Variovorax sp. KK3]
MSLALPQKPAQSSKIARESPRSSDSPTSSAELKQEGNVLKADSGVPQNNIDRAPTFSYLDGLHNQITKKWDYVASGAKHEREQEQRIHDKALRAKSSRQTNRILKKAQAKSDLRELIPRRTSTAEKQTLEKIYTPQKIHKNYKNHNNKLFQKTKTIYSNLFPQLFEGASKIHLENLNDDYEKLRFPAGPDTSEVQCEAEDVEYMFRKFCISSVVQSEGKHQAIDPTLWPAILASTQDVFKGYYELMQLARTQHSKEDLMMAPRLFEYEINKAVNGITL